MPNNKEDNQKKILLVNLPFWTPLIPAQGIASLKAFLQEHGYLVKVVDAAAENKFLEFYNDYFTLLRVYIPEENRGNFYNIGHDVLRNHMEAYFTHDDREKYLELVKQLVHHTYHTYLKKPQVFGLDIIMSRFFRDLRSYFLALLDEEKPAVLGLSVHSGNLGSSTALFKLTREHFPEIKTVMGGSIFFNHLAKGTPDLERFLERTESYVDKLFIGKGEQLFLKYLQGELPEEQRVYTLEDTKGSEPNLKVANIPDMSDFQLNRYFYLAAAASSSCPNNCSFCNVRFFFGEHKKKDAAQVVEEIKRLHQMHVHHVFFMADSLINTVIDDLSKGLSKEKLPIYLDSYYRVDEPSCDIEKTIAWRKAGLYRVRIGAESGSQNVLKGMGKPSHRI